MIILNELSSYSFEDVAKDLSQSLFRYLKRMTDNASDADDLLQDTLIRIAKGLSDVKEKSKVKVWAFRIATNVVIDFYRKSKKNRDFTFNDEQICYQSEDDERFIVDEMNDCIREVLENLPVDYRATLILYNFDGLSLKEIAEFCGISVSAAKVRMHRGKKMLKQALERDCDFYYDKNGNLSCSEKE